MNVTTSASNYTHWHDVTGKLVRCSEATDFMHYEDDAAPTPTGFGFCPHLEDADGAPLVVEV